MNLNMATPLGTILMIIFGIVSIATILGNGFIIVVNSHSWWQRRKLVPCDLLLTCLSITRFLLQCVTFSNQCMYISSPVDFMCSYKLDGGGLAWIYFNMANFLGTTFLTVFYCVKITTFAHPLFLWLKSRIDRLVPRLLVMSLIAMIFFSLPGIVGLWRVKTSCRLVRNVTANKSHIEASGEAAYMTVRPLQFSFCLINFMVCLSASILLLVSLWRHTRNLKKSGTGTKDVSTQAHIKVIKQLVFFLVFYILYFVTNVIVTSNILKYGDAERLISDTILSLYPSAHSIILIWTNPKLKGACACILSSRGKSS